MDGGNAGAAGIADGVADEAEVVGAVADETVEGIALAVEVEVAELKIRRIGGEGAALEANHGVAGGGAGVIDIDGAVAGSLIDDPRGWRAAGGRGGRGREAVGTAAGADDRAGGGGGSGGGGRFGGRRGGARIGAAALRENLARG